MREAHVGTENIYNTYSSTHDNSKFKGNENNQADNEKHEKRRYFLGFENVYSTYGGT